jgi:peptidoglycan hydrolase CwlO-like protein
MAVVSGFTLTRANGEKVTYGQGYHESVPADDADHFYAKLHQAPDGKMPKPQATPADSATVIKTLQGQVDDLTRQSEASKNELAKSQDTVKQHEATIADLEKKLAAATKKTGST